MKAHIHHPSYRVRPYSDCTKSTSAFGSLCATACRTDWQAFGGVGIKFNDRVSVIVGYRHLGIDYSTNNGFLLDTALKGLVLAVGIRF